MGDSTSLNRKRKIKSPPASRWRFYVIYLDLLVRSILQGAVTKVEGQT